MREGDFTGVTYRECQVHGVSCGWYHGSGNINKQLDVPETNHFTSFCQDLFEYEKILPVLRGEALNHVVTMLADVSVRLTWGRIAPESPVVVISLNLQGQIWRRCWFWITTLPCGSLLRWWSARSHWLIAVFEAGFIENWLECQVSQSFILQNFFWLSGPHPTQFFCWFSWCFIFCQLFAWTCHDIAVDRYQQPQ